MADALETVLRLRRLARETAIHALGTALRQEAEAAAELATLQTVLHREMAAAPRDPSHPLATSVPRWSGRAQTAIAAATARLAGAERNAGEARQGLRRAEAALKAAEALADVRQEATRRQAGRRAQHAMDEAASLSFDRAGPPSVARDPCR